MTVIVCIVIRYLAFIQECLHVETPGGGGYGKPLPSDNQEENELESERTETQASWLDNKTLNKPIYTGIYWSDTAYLSTSLVGLSNNFDF